MQRTACNTHARTHEHPRGCGTLACTHARTLYRALTHLAEPLCCERVVCLAPDAHPTEGGRRATCSTRYATRNIQHDLHVSSEDAHTNSPSSSKRKGTIRRYALCAPHDSTARARTKQRIGPDDGGNGWPAEHVKTRGEGSLVYDIQETARSSKHATRRVARSMQWRTEETPCSSGRCCRYATE